MKRKDKYAIRKLTTGAASVLIGVALFGAAGTQVKADTNVPNSQQEQTSQLTQNEAGSNSDIGKQEQVSQPTPKTGSSTTDTGSNDKSDINNKSQQLTDNSQSHEQPNK